MLKKISYLLFLITASSFTTANTAFADNSINLTFNVDVDIPAEVYIQPMAPHTIHELHGSNFFDEDFGNMCIYSNSTNNQYHITFTGRASAPSWPKPDTYKPRFPFTLPRTNPLTVSASCRHKSNCFFSYQPHFKPYHGIAIDVPNGQQVQEAVQGSADVNCADNHLASLSATFIAEPGDVGSYLFGIYSDTLTIEVKPA